MKLIDHTSLKIKLCIEGPGRKAGAVVLHQFFGKRYCSGQRVLKMIVGGSGSAGVVKCLHRRLKIAEYWETLHT